MPPSIKKNVLGPSGFGPRGQGFLEWLVGFGVPGALLFISPSYPRYLPLGLWIWGPDHTFLLQAGPLSILPCHLAFSSCSPASCLFPSGWVPA